MLTWSIAPVQPVSGKGGSARQRTTGYRHAPDGFLALLEELGGVARQDGFSAQSQPRQQAEEAREMDLLQNRIQHVNRLLTSFLAAGEK